MSSEKVCNAYIKWWAQMGCNKFNHLLLNDKTWIHTHISRTSHIVMQAMEINFRYKYTFFRSFSLRFFNVRKCIPLNETWYKTFFLLLGTLCVGVILFIHLIKFYKLEPFNANFLFFVLCLVHAAFSPSFFFFCFACFIFNFPAGSHLLLQFFFVFISNLF